MTAVPRAFPGHLLSPLQIGPVELANRIVSTAHQTTLVHEHLPTEDFVAYHEARARGEVGLIVLEATAVHESGLLTGHTLAGYLPAIVSGYRTVARAVKPHGTRLFVQLFHGGREQIASPPRAPALAPSAVPSSRFKVEPRAATEEEIDELVAGYARAAELAGEGGIEGVEISAAHNYLLAQFFTPELNRRTDRWRAGPALLLAVVDAVRRSAPELALGVRLSADSAAAASVAPLLADRVDYLSVALGESSTYRGSSGIVPPPPVPENVIGAHTEPFKVGPPLMATSRIVDPSEADRLLGSGVADALGMTRALIADPDLPRKVAEGRSPEVLRCIGCNACIAHYHAGTPIACAQNSRTGRERTLGPPELVTSPRRIVVVGAGPAGLAATAEALASGHEVIVLERAPQVGGQVKLAGAAPGHAELARTLHLNYEHLTHGADLRLETEASAELVASLAPDAVVLATGARPYEPELDLDGSEAVQAWDVLAGRLPEGRRVVVADWGGDATGFDAAEVLAAADKSVTLALASVAAGEGVHQYARNLYLARLYEAGVRLVHHVELAGAALGRLRFRNLFSPELEVELEADAVVLALGRVPVDDLAPELRALGLPVEEAGDCRSPRSLEEAIYEGTLASRRVAGGRPWTQKLSSLLRSSSNPAELFG
jgi:2,4-dienoyl-CoA reductase-like NADH-dependent reductase (Old Yellow Enzyme family)/thioredoxin reductase